MMNVNKHLTLSYKDSDRSATWEVQMLKMII